MMISCVFVFYGGPAAKAGKFVQFFITSTALKSARINSLSGAKILIF
jgi:hypothetical protein